jgi:putative membrane protein
MSNPTMSAEKKARIFIWTVSIVLPVAVTVLRYMPKIGPDGGALRSFFNLLPSFNALCNGTTAILLVLAFLAIRKKNIALHKRLMTTAMVLSIVFLLSYVTYHATTEHTVFPKESALWLTYQIILWSHIALSAIIVPLVLISYWRALAEKFDKHRRIAKLTLPLWLYVAVTGVMVYFLISPYYPF